MTRSTWAVAAAALAFATPAFAEDPDPISTGRPVTWRGTERVVVDTPVEMFTPHESVISPYIYLNRCTGGCAINGGGINDARTNTSTIPAPGAYTVAEYRNASGQTGAAADAEWNAVVQCLKEVYSPFAVTVTDQKPSGGQSYTMAVIAGTPSDIGLANDILGIAPLAGDCSPQDNVISFSFANHHGNTERVNNLCWTAAQETAHALGLDHEYMFSDGTSACNDPMTYRFDCGGQKFFRNKPASCGEQEVRQCRCGGSQNSHLKITNVFGAGTSLIPAPSCTIVTPTNGSTVQNGMIVAGSSGSQRGVAKVELWLNNYKWAEKPGSGFLANGQLNPSTYSIMMPADVPNGVIDVQLKCYDDLGLKTDSGISTVTKGAPCTSADACAKGQKCEAGKCFWDAPTGKLGADCDYNQFCESGICTTTSDGAFCSQACIVGTKDSCPADFECEPTGGTNGQCLPSGGGGGCCSVGDDGGPAWFHFGISALVLGFVVRRRRKRG
jgi:MYXO-CTERM domain-containing protein